MANRSQSRVTFSLPKTEQKVIVSASIQPQEPIVTNSIEKNECKRKIDSFHYRIFIFKMQLYWFLTHRLSSECW